jgi:hypothetical protein
MPPLRASITPRPVQCEASALVQTKLAPESKEQPTVSTSDALSEEARALKEMLLRQRSRLHRFSLSRMRKVVVPPVDIPHPLDVPGGLAYLVSGIKIPMTRDMARRHRKKLVRRLPATISERDANAYYA